MRRDPEIRAQLAGSYEPPRIPSSAESNAFSQTSMAARIGQLEMQVMALDGRIMALAERGTRLEDIETIGPD